MLFDGSRPSSSSAQASDFIPARPAPCKTGRYTGPVAQERNALERLALKPPAPQSTATDRAAHSALIVSG